MHQFIRCGLTLALGTMFAVVAGCGGNSGNATISSGSPEAFHENTLSEVGELLTIRKTDSNTPPASVADLAKYQNGWPAGFMAVKKGDVIVIWSAPVQEGVSDKVLAHEKTAAESGGYVLMQDGKTVKKMTADEFKAAPKAAK